MQLAELFRRLGARNPESWASSQLNEGIPQLARFLFLRQAWRLIVASGDRSWMSAHASSDPSSAVASALKRILESEVAESDLTTVVRHMQVALLFQFCQLVDDPGVLEEGVADIAWQLFQVGAEGQPIVAITGLHESVLQTDPEE